MGGGSGGGSTTTVDPAYNQGMLALSQEQQSWARELNNQFKYGTIYDPNERGTMVDGQWKTESQLQQEYTASQKGNKPSSGTATSTTTPSPGGQGQVANSDVFSNPYGVPQTTAATGSGGSPGTSTSGGGGGGGGKGQTFEEMYGKLTTRGDVEGYDPNAQVSEMEYMQRVVEANAGLLGLQTDVQRGQLESQKTLTPYMTEAQKQQAILSGRQAQADVGLIPYTTDASKYGALASTAGSKLSAAESKATLGLLPQKTGLTKQRYGLAGSAMTDAMQGANVGERVNQAQADVQHGFKNANRAAEMDLSSYGLDPSAGRYASTRREQSMAEAAGVAGARTKARTDTENENFQKKLQGLQIGF